MATKKQRRRHQTTRIYYGPEGRETSMYWTVSVTDAKKTVVINGTTMAAMRAHRGVTVGCAFSMVAMDNEEQFGHPVYLVSVTKSTLLVVDRLHKDGSPAHAVRYGHSYGPIVAMNDSGKLKKIIKERPEIMERSFSLKPPRKRPTGSHDVPSNQARGDTPRRTYTHHQGALNRAVKAGRISVSAAEQMSRAMSRRKRAAATSSAEPAH
jgi:hypothetical protein